MIHGGRRREHELTFQTRSRLLRSGPKAGHAIRYMNLKYKAQDRSKKNIFENLRRSEILTIFAGS